MRQARDLCGHALRLLQLNAKKPAQVNLRRAVSALYYALFHAWTVESAESFSMPPELRENVKRSISHGELRKLFSGVRVEGADLYPGCNLKASKELVDFAVLFVELLGRRQAADYDWTVKFRLADVADALFQVDEVIRNWKSFVRADDVRTLLAMTVIPEKRLRPHREE